MKKLSNILLVLVFFSNIIQAQDKQLDQLEKYYIYIDNFSPESYYYNAYFTIESSDKDFNKETYFFRINNTKLEHQSLYSLGERIDVKLDSLNLIRPKKYYKGKDYCDIHKALSLMNPKFGKQIMIITDLSNTQRARENPDKKFMVWSATYYGSIMQDYVWTNMGKGNILDWD